MPPLWRSSLGPDITRGTANTTATTSSTTNNSTDNSDNTGSANSINVMAVGNNGSSSSSSSSKKNETNIAVSSSFGTTRVSGVNGSAAVTSATALADGSPTGAGANAGAHVQAQANVSRAANATYGGGSAVGGESRKDLYGRLVANKLPSGVDGGRVGDGGRHRRHLLAAAAFDDGGGDAPSFAVVRMYGNGGSGGGGGGSSRGRRRLLQEDSSPAPPSAPASSLDSQMSNLTSGGGVSTAVVNASAFAVRLQYGAGVGDPTDPSAGPVFQGYWKMIPSPQVRHGLGTAQRCAQQYHTGVFREPSSTPAWGVRPPDLCSTAADPRGSRGEGPPDLGHRRLPPLSLPIPVPPPPLSSAPSLPAPPAFPAALSSGPHPQLPPIRSWALGWAFAAGERLVSSKDVFSDNVMQPGTLSANVSTVTLQVRRPAGLSLLSACQSVGLTVCQSLMWLPCIGLARIPGRAWGVGRGYPHHYRHRAAGHHDDGSSIHTTH